MILSVRPRFIFDQVPADVVYQIPNPRDSAGSPLLLEQCLLLGVAHIIEPKAIFEFGTFRGRTAYTLDLNFPRCLPGITTLDLEPSLSDNLLSGRRITRLKGHSVRFEYEKLAGQFDFVFIDGGHDQETVFSDSNHAFELLREEGPATIVWHDYSPLWPGTVMAIEEVARWQPGITLYRIEDTSLVVYLRRDQCERP
jgi:hypothetical protein